MEKFSCQKTSSFIQEETLAFLNSQRLSPTGLVESFHGSSKYLYNYSEGSFSLNESGYLEKQCFTYDQALAVIAYALLGEFEIAHHMLNLLNFNFHIEKGSRIGLFNSYRADGFCEDGQTLIMGIDGDRIHAGPNLWVGLACYQYMLLSGDCSFFPLCLEIVKWSIHKLQHFLTENGERGGISMGFGWGADWQRVYSTENNADYYALLNIIEHCYCEHSFAREIFDKQGLQLHEVQREKQGIEEWFRNVIYDAGHRFLSTGFNEKGIDGTKALDTVTFSILGFGIKKLLELGINPEHLINNAEKYLTVEVKSGKLRYQGFDFTDETGAAERKPLIWIEGTYQMGLTYQAISEYFQRNGDHQRSKLYSTKASKYLNNMEKLINYSKSEYQIPSYSLADSDEKEVLMTFRDEWEIPRGKNKKYVLAIASTVWRLMTILNFNPMSKDHLFAKR